MSALVPFEGHELAIQMFRGKPVIMAKDLGEALGYTPEGFRSTLKGWASELIEDVDVNVLRDEDRKEFLDGLDVRVKQTLTSAPAITVLYETGFDLVLIKTDKPAGKTLRRLLITEVLPKLRRGETIAPQVAPVAQRPELTDEERARAARMSMLPLMTEALAAMVATGWFDERFAKDQLSQAFQDASGRMLPAANQYPVNLEIFLEGKGARGKVAHDLASPFGKVVKARYVAVHGKEPPKKQEPGRAHTQYSYYDEDRVIIEEAFATFALKHPEVFAASLSTRRTG